MYLRCQQREEFVGWPETKAGLVLKIDVELFSLFDSVHDCKSVVEDCLAADLFFLHGLIYVTSSFALLALVRNKDLLACRSLFLVSS